MEKVFFTPGHHLGTVQQLSKVCALNSALLIRTTYKKSQKSNQMVKIKWLNIYLYAKKTSDWTDIQAIVITLHPVTSPKTFKDCTMTSANNMQSLRFDTVLTTDEARGTCHHVKPQERNYMDGSGRQFHSYTHRLQSVLSNHSWSVVTGAMNTHFNWFLHPHGSGTHSLPASK